MKIEKRKNLKYWNTALSIIACIFGSFNLNAQNDYFSPNQLRYDNAEYNANIKTVRLCPAGAETGYPIISLGSNQQLELSFDDISAEQKQLYYTFEHCSSDWLPSNFAFSFYIEGATYDFINDFDYSFNTLQNYIHYKTLIPSNEMRFKISGNYLLKVYEDNDPNQLILTRRLFVTDNKVGIKSQLMRPSGAKRDTDQDIDFIVNITGLGGTLAQHQIKAMVMQNGRWDKIINVNPIYSSKTELSYDYDDGTISFPAGNEFRFADIRSFRVNALGVAKINQDSSIRNIKMKVEKPRLFEQYTLLPDFNGQFVIRTFEGSQPDIDGDYLNVDFSFVSDPSYFGKAIHLIGAFNNWRLDAASRMNFDPEKGLYTKRLLLKQGLYNYCYVFGPSSNNLIEPNLLEGSFFNTENDYQIFIYNRAFGNLYESLVGVKVINTLQQN